MDGEEGDPIAGGDHHEDAADNAEATMRKDCRVLLGDGKVTEDAGYKGEAGENKAALPVTLDDTLSSLCKVLLTTGCLLIFCFSDEGTS